MGGFDSGRFDQGRFDDGGGPPAPPFTDTTILDGTILNGLLPVRADDFAFTLLDRYGTDLGTLAVSAETTVPTVRFDTSRTVMRTVSGIEVMRTDLADIDTEHERLRVEMVLQNGSRYPLGTLMFGQDNQSPSSFGNLLTPELFDEMFLIDQPLAQTVSIPAGGSIYGLIATLLAPFESLVRTIDRPDVAAVSPLLFLAGTSRYAALSAAATLLGCFAPYIDNGHTLRFKAPLAAGDTSVDHLYPMGAPGSSVLVAPASGTSIGYDAMVGYDSPDYSYLGFSGSGGGSPVTVQVAAIFGRIIDESVQLTNDSYKAPNRYVVVGQDPVNPVVGVYDLPDSAPNSAANRDGRIVTAPVHTVQGVADVATAVGIAYRDSIVDRTAYGKVTFAATADPRHDGFDLLNVLGVRYLETAWELELTSGGQHRHEGTTLWVQ